MLGRTNWNIAAVLAKLTMIILGLCGASANSMLLIGNMVSQASAQVCVSLSVCACAPCVRVSLCVCVCAMCVCVCVSLCVCLSLSVCACAPCVCVCACALCVCVRLSPHVCVCHVCLSECVWVRPVAVLSAKLACMTLVDVRVACGMRYAPVESREHLGSNTH